MIDRSPAGLATTPDRGRGGHEVEVDRDYTGKASTPTEAPGPSLPLIVRTAGERDVGFICTSWMASLRDREPWHSLDRNYFFAAQHALIYRLLERAGTLTLIACSPRNPDQLYGFIVAEPLRGDPLLHWLYTKSATTGKGPGYRRAKVATRLMEHAFPDLGDVPITCSIRTPICAMLPADWRLVFNTQRLCTVVEAPKL